MTIKYGRNLSVEKLAMQPTPAIRHLENFVAAANEVNTLQDKNEELKELARFWIDTCWKGDKKNEALRAELAKAKAENEELNKRRQNSIVNSVELEKKNKALKKELAETVDELGEVVRRLRAEKS